MEATSGLEAMEATPATIITDINDVQLPIQQPQQWVPRPRPRQRLQPRSPTRWGCPPMPTCTPRVSFRLYLHSCQICHYNKIQLSLKIMRPCSIWQRGWVRSNPKAWLNQILKCYPRTDILVTDRKTIRLHAWSACAILRSDSRFESFLAATNSIRSALTNG